MLVQTIKLIGANKDGTVDGLDSTLSLRVQLWNGLDAAGLPIQFSTSFGGFPEIMYQNTLGIEATHASIGGWRSRTDLEQIGFVQFIDISGSKKKVKIPIGDINGITFGVFLLTAFPLSVPMPTFLLDTFFAIPPLLQF